MNYLWFADASSSNEAVHLQQRLRSLSSELVTLRNRLHVQGAPGSTALKGSNNTINSSANNNNNNGAQLLQQSQQQPQQQQQQQQPAVPPRNVAPVLAPPLAPPLEPRSQGGAASASLEDLIRLQAPLTEDAVTKCLQARFAASQFYVSI